MNAAQRELFRELLTYMAEDPRSITSSIHVLFIAKNLERIGDHATNVAEMVYFAATGEHLGDRAKGAPNLTDKEWLYGGDPATIRRTIFGPRNGVMPTWDSRLDPATIRALAIYVHALGGGE